VVPGAESFLDNYLPYVLRRADQTLSAPFYERLTSMGIARSEWRVLAVLHEFGELSVLDLTAASLSPQPTVTHAVRRLADRGLVTRVAGTVDRRQRFISMTPRGSELTTTLMDQAKRLESSALAEADDLSGLAAALKQLTTIVERHAEAQNALAADLTRETA